MNKKTKPEGEMKKNTTSRTPTTPARDAVETAIDLAKSDPSLTWEEQLARQPGRVTPWPSASDPTPS